MALVKLLQIAGYQDSGKTTLLTAIIEHIEQSGKKAAVLKHHGHGGIPDLPLKDSSRHFEAGAVAAMVDGGGIINLTAKLDELGIDKKLELLALFSPDIILIEGYKKKPFPKIVMIRRSEEVDLLDQLECIQAVVVWPESEKIVNDWNMTVPVFSLNDGRLFEWIDGYIYKDSH